MEYVASVAAPVDSDELERGRVGVRHDSVRVEHVRLVPRIDIGKRNERCQVRGRDLPPLEVRRRRICREAVVQGPKGARVCALDRMLHAALPFVPRHEHDLVAVALIAAVTSADQQRQRARGRGTPSDLAAVSGRVERGRNSRALDADRSGSPYHRLDH